MSLAPASGEELGLVSFVLSCKPNVLQRDELLELYYMSGYRGDLRARGTKRISRL